MNSLQSKQKAQGETGQQSEIVSKCKKIIYKSSKKLKRLDMPKCYVILHDMPNAE